MKISVFKTEDGRDKIRAYYNQVLSQFPFGQKYVETTYGKTFVLTAGQESNPPIILLHGSCSNSAFWFPEIMALSNSFRVYAIDIVGEAGNSEEYRLDLSSDAYALWMRDVLDALKLERAIIAGNSLGGWMALKFATAFPQQVSKLILIASTGIAEIRPQFLAKAEHELQPGKTAAVDPSILGQASIPKEVLYFMNLIVENYNPVQYLPVFTDEQLLQLDMPVLFVGGENDSIVDTQASAQRLSNLLPMAGVHVLPNCGHAVFNSIEYIIPFLMNAHT